MLQMNRRRERILEAARELISDEGFENLTMRSLAVASGVTVPTIYNLIGNKDEVLAASIHEGMLRFFESLDPSTSNPIAIFEQNVSLLLGKPTYYRPVLRALLNGGASGEMAELNDRYLDHLEKTVERLREAGDVERWIDPGVLAERLLSIFYGAITDWASSGLSNAALTSAVSYDAYAILAGAGTEKGHRRFQNRMRKLQKGQIRSKRRRTRSRGAAGGRATM